jgi:hypothetical protein
MCLGEPSRRPEVELPGCRGRSDARAAAPVAKSAACQHDDHDNDKEQPEQRADPDAAKDRGEYQDDDGSSTRPIQEPPISVSAGWLSEEKGARVLARRALSDMVIVHPRQLAEDRGDRERLEGRAALGVEAVDRP